MKKIVAISLILFFVLLTAIFTAGLIVREINKNNPLSNTTTKNNPNGVSVDIQKQILNTITSSLTLNTTEIAKHNKASDCWMTINGKVYNFTSYIDMHPGGNAMIINSCGKDATNDYMTKDQAVPRNHSQYAKSLLADYYIGDLNQTLTP